jgi:CRISPR-associated protein Csm3
MEKLVKKIKISTSIELITGLHIGGSSDSVEIGGIDTPVIKVATKNGQPYIPGSSLRGKIRCLLEQIDGIPKVEKDIKIKKNDDGIGKSDKVNKLFGYSKENIPSKLIVRDAYLKKESKELLCKCDNLDMPYTESKWENVINRIKGTAEHPRQIERIPAGVSFDVEFIINVWDDDKDDGKELVALLEKGIHALENDYLGGNGSRGYGQIKFGERKQEDITFDKNFYWLC